MPLHLFSTTLHIVLPLCSFQSLSSFLFNHDLWYKYGTISLLSVPANLQMTPSLLQLFHSFPWLTLEKHLYYLQSLVFSATIFISFLMDWDVSSFILFSTLFWIHLHSQFSTALHRILATGHWLGSIPFRLFNMSLHWSYLLLQISFEKRFPDSVSEALPH